MNNGGVRRQEPNEREWGTRRGRPSWRSPGSTARLVARRRLCQRSYCMGGGDAVATHHEFFEIQSDLLPTFHDVTERVKEIASRSGITEGIAVVYSQHTTCSVIIQ